MAPVACADHGAQGARSGARGQSAKPRVKPHVEPHVDEPALTWPVAGARQAWGVARPHAEFLLSTKIRKWAAEEVVGGRLFPWFAVAYGFGIVLYFTAEREPASLGGDGFGDRLHRRCRDAAPASRWVRRGAGPVRHGGWLCGRDNEHRAHGASGAALSGLGRDDFRLCRAARRKPAHRPLRAARRAYGRRPHGGEAAACAALREARHGAAGRRFRSKSKRCSIRRCSRSRPAATISPAIFSFRASARPASYAAASTFSRRPPRKVRCSARMHPCRACATPSMRASAPSCRATPARSPPC